MNFLAVAHRATGAIDAQQQHRKLLLLHLANGLQHPFAGAAGDGPFKADASNTFAA